MILVLYTFRIILRDIVVPISEWPVLYIKFKDSKQFGDLINAQAFIFDFIDFLVAMLSAAFFYRSAKESR